MRRRVSCTSDHDVDQAAGDDDHLAGRLTLRVAQEGLAGDRCGLDSRAISLRGDTD